MKNKEFSRIERQLHTPEPSALKDFGDIISVGTYCFDSDGNEVLYTHHYESPYGHILFRDKITGAVYLDGNIDPKRMLDDGVQYHLRKGVQKDEPEQE